jgi:hypothetical protein
MSTLRHIIYREWITRVRRKAFVIGTLLIPALFAGSIGIGVWLESGSEEESKVLIVDASELISRFDDRREVWLPIHPDCFPERSTLTYRFATESMADDAFMQSDFDLMVSLMMEYSNIRVPNIFMRKRRRCPRNGSFPMIWPLPLKGSK